MGASIIWVMNHNYLMDFVKFFYFENLNSFHLKPFLFSLFSRFYSVFVVYIAQICLIYLNRPKALNALDLEMTDLFYKKLNDWKNNIKIKRVLIKGNGRAFCAGGDVKSLFLSSGVSNLKKEFLFKEYTLNYEINKFTKPYLSIWNGIVMGGGVGLSIYGNARIASEKTKFAMPETAIGFFPDVGGSYFLSNFK